MGYLTESDKRDFIHFIFGILDQSADTITKEGKQGIKFDTPGYKTLMETKNKKVETEEKIEDDMDIRKLEQVKKTNKVLADAYKTASEIAEAIVSHMGDDHALSGNIRKERGSKHKSPPDDDSSE